MELELSQKIWLWSEDFLWSLSCLIDLLRLCSNWIRVSILYLLFEKWINTFKLNYKLFIFIFYIFMWFVDVWTSNWTLNCEEIHIERLRIFIDEMQWFCVWLVCFTFFYFYLIVVLMIWYLGGKKEGKLILQKRKKKSQIEVYFSLGFVGNFFWSSYFYFLKIIFYFSLPWNF